MLAEKAVEQIESRAHYTDLKSCGCQEIVLYGMAFTEKKVEISSKRFNG